MDALPAVYKRDKFSGAGCAGPGFRVIITFIRMKM